MHLEERFQRATGSVEDISKALYDSSEQVLIALLDNPHLTEDHLMVLLSRKSLPPNVLRDLGMRDKLLRPYRVKLALVRHPRCPRGVALTLVRYLYPFDLVKVALTPAAAPELRRVAEEAMMGRAATMPLGERLTLARLGTARLAGTLLADAHPRVFRTSLDNPRLTEEFVVKALRQRPGLSAEAVAAIAAHGRWMSQYEVKLALIRHPAASLRTVLQLVNEVRDADLADLTADPLMPGERRVYLRQFVRARRSRAARRPRSSAARSGAT